MKKVTLLVLALGFGLFSYAQDSTATKDNSKKDETVKYRSWSIGADFGWSALFGDYHVRETNRLEYNDQYSGPDLGFMLNIQHWRSSAWGVKGRAGWLSYSGSQGVYAVRSNSTFRGDVSVQLNLAGMGARNHYQKERKYALIIYGGIGMTWSDAIVYREGNDFLKLGTDDQDEFNWGNEEARKEKSHNSVYMPFGLEYRYRFAERWDLKIGADFLWAMDDNFDGSETTIKNQIGQVFPPSKDIAELWFGNTTNDFLAYFNVGVNYHFSWFKMHEDGTPIIYADGFSGLEKRVKANEDNLEKVMGDADNDGVSDYFDKEPETPEGYMVYGGGQAVDQDKDGIPDEIDEDPYSTKGAKVDANGREIDGDGDGVYDGLDLEPNSKPGAFVNFQGVTIIDKVGGGNEAFLPMIYFDFDKSNITSANYQRLATIARFLEANPTVNLNVYGHTDKVGGESYNFKLSDRRAKAAKMALVNDFGVDPSRIIEVKGEGKTQLWSKRDDVNRRAEFHIAK